MQDSVLELDNRSENFYTLHNFSQTYPISTDTEMSLNIFKIVILISHILNKLRQ